MPTPVCLRRLTQVSYLSCTVSFFPGSFASPPVWWLPAQRHFPDSKNFTTTKDERDSTLRDGTLQGPWLRPQSGVLKYVKLIKSVASQERDTVCPQVTFGKHVDWFNVFYKYSHHIAKLSAFIKKEFQRKIAGSRSQRNSSWQGAERRNEHT